MTPPRGIPRVAGSRPRTQEQCPPLRPAFTLIELLVVVAVVALLLALLLPALAGASRAGRSAACMSNLRQCYVFCRIYADDNAGVAPAIGQPYTELPNWALVVQAASGRDGAGAALYAESSALVCPEARFAYGRTMTRTYAMNATGHAGAPSDPDNYDLLPAKGKPPPAVHLDRVRRPGVTPLLMDSSPPAPGPGQPPPTRTSSVIDFRNPAHNPARLGVIHENARAFNAARCDGSATPHRDVPAEWLEPLP